MDDKRFPVLLTKFFNPKFSALVATETVRDVAGEEFYFRDACVLLHQLQVVKGLTYRRSWCEEGLEGIFYGNLCRKWHRLRNLMKSGHPLEFPGESFEETVGDLAVYSVKLLGWLKENYPERFLAYQQRLLDEVNEAKEYVEFIP